jgi:hypothetical protein
MVLFSLTFLHSNQQLPETQTIMRSVFRYH